MMYKKTVVELFRMYDAAAEIQRAVLAILAISPELAKLPAAEDSVLPDGVDDGDSSEK